MNAAIFAPLREQGSELLPLIATIGVSVLMQNAMLAWFGPIPYAFDSPYSNDVIRFGGAFITMQNVLIIGVSQDHQTPGRMGINPNQLGMLPFVIASALAGMAGALLGPVLVLTPFAG